MGDRNARGEILRGERLELLVIVCRMSLVRLDSLR